MSSRREVVSTQARKPGALADRSLRGGLDIELDLARQGLRRCGRVQTEERQLQSRLRLLVQLDVTALDVGLGDRRLEGLAVVPADAGDDHVRDLGNRSERPTAKL